jgi:inosine-uridine nucleoside N-ribohydrolase
VRLWVDTDLHADDLLALRCARAHPAVELVGVSVVDGPGDPLPVELPPVDALLAIGPLTNVARLLEAGATLPRLVVMGGALEPVPYKGRIYDVEHNFDRDPAAAATVLGSTRVTLVPLDVTAALRLEPDVTVHDPVALLVAAGEPIATTAPTRLVVDATGRVDRNDRGREHDVVIAVDAEAALARIVALLA